MSNLTTTMLPPPGANFRGSVASAVFLVVLLIFSIFLNVLVCTAVVRCKKLRMAASAFIFNMCIANLLLTFLSMPIWLGYQIQGYSFWRESFHFSKFWYMVDIIGGTVSIASLTAISVAKYFAITRPLTHKDVINRKSITAVLVLIWVYAFLASPIYIKTKKPLRAYLLWAHCLVPPLTIILIAYGKIYHIARSQAQQLNVQAGRKKAKEIKALKTIAIIVGTFCICWLPFFVLSIMLGHIHTTNMHFANAVKWLQYVNAFLSPLLYIIFDRRFRTVISNWLAKCFSENHYRQPTESNLVPSDPTPQKTSSSD